MVGQFKSNLLACDKPVWKDLYFSPRSPVFGAPRTLVNCRRLQRIIAVKRMLTD
jgi:hypothetical protein